MPTACWGHCLDSLPQEAPLDFPAVIFFAFAGKHITFICLLYDLLTSLALETVMATYFALMESFCPFKPNTSLLQLVGLKTNWLFLKGQVLLLDNDVIV